MDILIDFDGTCVTHDFPRIGKNIGSQSVLKKLVKAGHNLILFTMRSDNAIVGPNRIGGEIVKAEGLFLQEAVDWFADNNIPLYGVQTNPTQHEWTKSPKAYGQLIIDDIGLGAPLCSNDDLSNREFVDWVGVEQMLRLRGILP